ncbi:hypothetical protein [Pseudanabaena sp. FACHB-2040]|uniref:hypothetical protein n=1 Tax=Pseudanabaena sp. FACHB-2040 TaxID=2692859 RepID=UPI0016887040|nr:hypothetical protein [Pseudanabaena sp. FACHB-2040]MBD2260607.1 hypothetical protein [Pseudanabaena sp. FACHB-2040]
MHQPTLNTAQIPSSVRVYISPASRDIQRKKAAAAAALLRRDQSSREQPFSSSEFAPVNPAAAQPQAQPHQPPRRSPLHEPGTQAALMGVGSLALASALGLWLTTEANQQQATAPQLLPPAQAQTAEQGSLPVPAPAPLASEPVPTAPAPTDLPAAQQAPSSTPRWTTVPVPSNGAPAASFSRFKVADTLQQMVDRQAADLAAAQANARSASSSAASPPPSASPTAQVNGQATSATSPRSMSAFSASHSYTRGLPPILPTAPTAATLQVSPSPVAGPAPTASISQQSPTQPSAHVNPSVIQAQRPSVAPAVTVAPALPVMTAPASPVAGSSATEPPITTPPITVAPEAAPDPKAPAQPQEALKAPQQPLAIALTPELSQDLASINELSSFPVLQVDWATYQQAWAALQVNPEQIPAAPLSGYIDYSRSLVVVPIDVGQ